MKEIFKFYKDTSRFPKGAVYYVSNYGRVKRNNILSEPCFSGGYYRIGHDFLHRVVYELFIGKIPDGYVVDHIDTNSRNNNITNLRACTQSENIKNSLTITKLSNSMKGNTNGKGNKGRVFLFFIRKKLSDARKAYYNKIKNSKI